MKRWSSLVESRYEVLASISYDSLQDILHRIDVLRKENGSANYREAVFSHYIDWLRNQGDIRNAKNVERKLNK